tara:strand:+ start:4614 stop:5696 length:1083 start_codon:yes stop_codon:yes gene_type:complete
MKRCVNGGAKPIPISAKINNLINKEVMVWSWNARGDLPADARGTGTASGGAIGSASEAAQTKAWPRYEAEYLKRALLSDEYKFNTRGLDDVQKSIYLDKIVEQYKAEADECLKAEFEQWLQGMHEANDASKDQVYENCDGKPVRRWVYQDEADLNGGYKVGQPRAGWKHTPWGRAQLTHVHGVREYLRETAEAAHKKDVEMQLLAEHGPQNVKEAWMYFKHWVKGRPLSDAVCLPDHFEKIGQRSDFGPQPPGRMHDYDPQYQHDRQPDVLASDENAQTAGIALPGEPAKPLVSESASTRIAEAKTFNAKLEALLQGDGWPAFPQSDPRTKAAERADKDKAADDNRRLDAVESKQSPFPC